MKNIYRKQIEQIINSIQLEYDINIPKCKFTEALSNALYVHFYINAIPFKANISQKTFEASIQNLENKWITDFISDPNYFFFYGQKAINQETEMGRFYINARVENCKNLVNNLMTSLVNAGISFSMKCHKNIKEYARADNLVLYFEQRKYHKVLKIVKKLVLENVDFVKKYGPLFTKEILPGLYFAEDPGIANESFGTLRCKLIAASIWECVSQNIPQKNWIKYCLQNITKFGYDLTKFYENQNLNIK